MSATEIPRWAPGASEEYKRARNDLVKEEWALRNQIEKVAAQRRALPLGPIMPTYEFCEGPKDITVTDGSPTKTSLADLAADGRSVVIYNMMYAPGDEQPCGMCANVVDGFNGVSKHLDQVVNFAIVAKAPIKQLRAYAAKRGWNKLRFLSSSENSFNADMNMEKVSYMPEYEGQIPGISVFKKDDEGNVRHHYSMSADFDKDTQRGLDAITPLWNVLDLVPEGRGDFMASNKYVFN